MSNIDVRLALRAEPAPGTAAALLRVACYLPDLGESVAERIGLLQALAHQGVEATLLLTHDDGFLDAAASAGIEVVNFGNKRVGADLRPLTAWLRRNKPDVLLASMGHNDVVASLARIASGSRDTRLVLCRHDTLSHAAKNGGSHRVLRTLLRALAPASHGIVAASHRIADDVAVTAGLRRDRISVIPNPVVMPALAIRAAAPLEHTWFAPGAPPVYVTAGPLVRQKDHATLLRAFALHRRTQVSRLLILGEGPLRAELERHAERLGIASDVRFEGSVANPLPYVRRAAAFVLSSLREEGSCRELVEALACGTPVISTDCPHGPAEILGNGTWGVLAPLGSDVLLARALDPDLRRRFSPSALRRRADDFSVERAAASYCTLMSGHCEDRRMARRHIAPEAAGAGRLGWLRAAMRNAGGLSGTEPAPAAGGRLLPGRGADAHLAQPSLVLRQA